MSLGLPEHLVSRRTSSAIASAMHIAALVCIAASAVALVGYQSTTELIVWPAALALLPLAALLIALHRHPQPVVTVAALACGAAGLAVFATTVMSMVPAVSTTSEFVVTTAKLSVMLIAGAGSSGLAVMGWMAAGLLVSEGVVAISAAISDVAYRYDATTARVFVLVGVIIGISALVRRRTRRAQPTLHRAAQADELQRHRARMESRAAALLHDTALNDLAAISGSSVGAMKNILRSRINADLEMLVGQDWLGDFADAASDDSAGDDDGVLSAAIAETRALGIDVTVSGSLASLDRLPSNAARAVSLAVRQCLVNVHKHAKTAQAEVVISSSPTEVSVMVVDGGTGFDLDSVGESRLGLRQSVIERVHDVGGVAHVWSTPGHGTSVFIAVPIANDDDARARVTPL